MVAVSPSLFNMQLRHVGRCDDELTTELLNHWLLTVSTRAVINCGDSDGR